MQNSKDLRLLETFRKTLDHEKGVKNQSYLLSEKFPSLHQRSSSQCSKIDSLTRDISHRFDPISKPKTKFETHEAKLQEILGIKQESYKLPTSLQDLQESLKKNSVEENSKEKLMQDLENIKSLNSAQKEKFLGSVLKEGGLLYRTQSGLLQPQVVKLYENILKRTKGISVDLPRSEIDLGAPSGRKEVEIIITWLESMINFHIKEVNDLTLEEKVKRAQLIYTACYKEVIRQVSVHCIERGVLLQKIWNAQVDLNCIKEDNRIKELEEIKDRVNKILEQNVNEYKNKLENSEKVCKELKDLIREKDKDIDEMTKKFEELFVKPDKPTLLDIGFHRSKPKKVSNFAKKKTLRVENSGKPAEKPQKIELKKPTILFGYFDEENVFHKQKTLQKNEDGMSLNSYFDEVVLLASVKDQEINTENEKTEEISKKILDIEEEINKNNRFLNKYSQAPDKKVVLKFVKHRNLGVFNEYKGEIIEKNTENIIEKNTENKKPEKKIIRLNKAVDTEDLKTEILLVKNNKKIDKKVDKKINKQKTLRIKSIDNENSSIVENSRSFSESSDVLNDKDESFKDKKRNKKGIKISFNGKLKKNFTNVALKKKKIEKNKKSDEKSKNNLVVKNLKEEKKLEKNKEKAENLKNSEKIEKIEKIEKKFAKFQESEETPKKSEENPKNFEENSKNFEDPKNSEEKTDNEKYSELLEESDTNKSNEMEVDNFELSIIQEKTFENKEITPKQENFEERKIFIEKNENSGEIKYKIKDQKFDHFEEEKEKFMNKKDAKKVSKDNHQLLQEKKSSKYKNLSEKNEQNSEKVAENSLETVENPEKYNEKPFETPETPKKPEKSLKKYEKNLLPNDKSCQVLINPIPYEDLTRSQILSSIQQLKTALKDISKDKSRKQALIKDPRSLSRGKKLKKLLTSLFTIKEEGPSLISDPKKHNKSSQTYKNDHSDDNLLALSPSHKEKHFISTTEDLESEGLNNWSHSKRFSSRLQQRKKSQLVFEEFLLGQVSRKLIITHPGQKMLNLVIESMDSNSNCNMSLKSLLKVINSVYAEKNLLCKDNPNYKKYEASMILYDSLINKYGLKTVAETKFRQIVLASMFYKEKYIRIKNFYRFLGIEDGFTVEEWNFYLNAVECIEFANIGHNFFAENDHYSSIQRLVYCTHSVFDNKLPEETVDEIEKIVLNMKENEGLFNKKKNNKVYDVANADVFLDMILGYYKRLKDKIFEKFFGNYNKEHTFYEKEFGNVMKSLFYAEDEMVEKIFELNFVMKKDEENKIVKVVRIDSLLSAVAEYTLCDLKAVYKNN